MHRNPLITSELVLMLEAGEEEAVREFVEEHEPARAAELIEDLDRGHADRAIRLLEPRFRAQVFSYFPSERQEGLLEAFGPKESAELLRFMPHDDRADLVHRLDEGIAEAILRQMAHADREDIKRLASYEPGTAGAVMTTDYAALPARISVREALEQLRREAPDRETINTSYVIDHNRKLLGVVSLIDLVLARPATWIEDVMTAEFVSAQIDEDQEEVAKKIAKYDLLALPVVDTEGRMLGIVTHDDAMDILRQEQADDFLALAGVQASAEPDESEYWQARLWDVVRRRIVWLLPLFLSGMLTSWAQDRFHWLGDALLVTLTASVPLLIGTGGNAGSQTVGTIIRGLALGEIAPNDAYRVLLREWLTGTILGTLLGSLGFAYAFALKGYSFATALVIGLSQLCICMWANAVGAIVPLAARKLKIDPALVSAPLISTLVDVTGLVIYFTIAAMLLYRAIP